ncbi:hypothetical protein ACQPXM_08005 [Kribbella sp. CA-253562]|uniref:hypothetical protein n=1 Tax=Kribbella sp. CA-253562 TaxID=3239942 RepID=UPI003D900D31
MSAKRKWAVAGTIAAVSGIGLGTAAYAAPADLNDPAPAQPTASTSGPATSVQPTTGAVQSADTPGETNTTNTPGDTASANTPGDTTSANTPGDTASANSPANTNTVNTPNDTNSANTADSPS